jgi:hypothetical protein
VPDGDLLRLQKVELELMRETARIEGLEDSFDVFGFTLMLEGDR